MIRIINARDFSRERWKPASDEKIEVVFKIIEQVKIHRDQALRELTAKLDGVYLSNFQVEEDEWEKAMELVEKDTFEALEEAAKRIKDYHEKQKQKSWIETATDGTILGQLVRPLDRVGLYVPGGKAVYPSSVLMNGIPAQIAGVPERVMVTPPRPDGTVHPLLLVAARLAGITAVYKVGGAQAIAALAYGTESIPAVDKIIGPGNIYVALAKQAVFGQVAIDSVAGPSEIVIVADSTANPVYVAADLLSQAEHDPLAAAILITPDQEIARKVSTEINRQIQQLERRKIAMESLKNRGAILLVDHLDEAFDVVNRIAPEHLELLLEEPWAYVAKVRHAGAIFLGPYSPEPIGDYFAGPNHVLPTQGTARFFSPLSVEDFVKKSSLIAYSKKALFRDAKKVIQLANAEGLTAHAFSIAVRLEDEKREKEAE